MDTIRLASLQKCFDHAAQSLHLENHQGLLAQQLALSFQGCQAHALLSLFV